MKENSYQIIINNNAMLQYRNQDFCSSFFFSISHLCVYPDDCFINESFVL